MLAMPGPLARSDARPLVIQTVAGSIPRSTFFVEIDHEIISTAILFLLLIQVWHVSVTGERMCT